tara:strand:+ start:608 stop:1618 length:1011 start_codon:yes stop_codon:yes gene_type:complete
MQLFQTSQKTKMKYIKKTSFNAEEKSVATKHEFNGPTLTTPTYAGELALPFVSAALKSGATLANGWIRTIDDVYYKAVINQIEGASLIADASCDFADAGSVTITENVLTTKELAVNIDLCKKTMRQSWLAADTGNSLNSNMPSAFSDYVIGHIAGLVAQQVENDIWTGADATGGEFEGFLTATTGIFVVDGTVNAVTTVSPFTKAIVVVEIEKVLDACSSEVLAKPDFALYVSPKTAFLYQQHLGSEGFSNDYQANAKPSNIYGYPIYACPGMPDNQIVATYESNLVFGSNILTNMTEVRTIDMSPIDGSDNVRFIMRYAAGVQVGVGADIYWGKA